MGLFRTKQDTDQNRKSVLAKQRHKYGLIDAYPRQYAEHPSQISEKILKVCHCEAGPGQYDYE